MLTLLLLLACSGHAPEPAAPSVPAGEWANVAPARVEAALTGEGRSYLDIQEGPYRFWVSVPQGAYKVGDHVLLGKGPLQKGVRSEANGRTFDELTVVEQAAVVDEATALAAARLPVAEGGLDIAGLYARRTALAGQEVKVRGRVVRVSRNVFGTNWYHLRDGTRGPGEGEDDLTVTTTQEIPVGAVVLASGPLTVDLDLGFGYFYAAILKDAKVVQEPEGS